MQLPIYLQKFRRKEHGSISENRLIDMVENPQKLGIGFSTIDIPSRSFLCDWELCSDTYKMGI